MFTIYHDDDDLQAYLDQEVSVDWFRRLAHVWQEVYELLNCRFISRDSKQDILGGELFNPWYFNDLDLTVFEALHHMMINRGITLFFPLIISLMNSIEHSSIGGKQS